MNTKPRTKQRGRAHVGSTIRSLAWEWLKLKHPDIAERIRIVAYEDCGLEPPNPSAVHPHLLELLNKAKV